jgi:lipoate-protein ligase B
MGRVAYGPMLTLQQQRHELVAAGESADTLFLLEHEPVVTLGRNSGNGNVLVSREILAERGIELFATGRGGDVTFHGPGQLVGYPILRLTESERDVRRYVGCLEEIMIRAAADFGVAATRVEGKRGIWVGNAKLGAVGVRIAGWTTMHGFAINVATGITGFDLIVPCGLVGTSVTSLASLCGCSVKLREVEDRLVAHAAAVLDRTPIETTASPLPAAPPSMTTAGQELRL